MGLFDRLKDGLSKTRKGFSEKVDSIFAGRAVNEETLEELEETLILSDWLKSGSELDRERVNQRGGELSRIDPSFEFKGV